MCIRDSEHTLDTQSGDLPRVVLIEDEYRRTMTKAELNWVEDVIEDLRSGVLTWSEDLSLIHICKVIQFPGYLRAYVEGEDDPEAELADREVHLPPMDEGDPVSVDDLEPGSHATQPPARYTEASLVKAMEELGVGRPSTYASVIATILDRGYVWKKGTALVRCV